MKRLCPTRTAVLFLSLSASALSVSGAETADPKAEQLSLSISVGEREYKGEKIDGEEHRVARGDSLWRILVQEKGLSGKRFAQYRIVIHALNPQLRSREVLRIGESLFIPLELDRLVDAPSAPLRSEPASKPPITEAATQDYRVRAGDNLHQILRDKLGIVDERAIAVHFALVKDLNPQKKNWNLLIEGETIRLPLASKTIGSRAAGASESRGAIAGKGASPSPAPSIPRTGEHPAQSIARDNIGLITRVLEAFGNEVVRTGEEVLAVTDGTVRLERNAFPLLYNRKLNQRVILDADGKIPATIRLKLRSQPEAPSVFSLPGGFSVKQAVSELLSRLGFQPLNSEQPVVVQDGGLVFEARGDWMALGPEEHAKRQPIFVVNLTDKLGSTPEYLRARLAALGLFVNEVTLSSAAAPVFIAAGETTEAAPRSKQWPQDKSALVDALLAAYGVRFFGSETLRVTARGGVAIETVCDRTFTLDEKKTALFFRRLAPEIKEVLDQATAVKPLELDLRALSTQDIIAQLAGELGDDASYREHRFNAWTGAQPGKLIVGARGFLLPKARLFVTDREIPAGYHRFFFDQGLDIVYFR